MGGQSDNTDRRQRASAAFDRIRDSASDVLSDEEKLSQIRDNVSDSAVRTLEGIADTAVGVAEGTADSIEGIANGDQIDFQTLKAKADLGDENVMAYLGTAVGLASTAAGPVGLALRAGGASGLYKILTGEDAEPETSAENTQTQQQGPWYMKLWNKYQSEGIMAAVGSVFEPIRSKLDFVSSIKDFLQGLSDRFNLGFNVGNLLGQAEGMVDIAEEQVTQIASGLDVPSAPEGTSQNRGLDNTPNISDGYNTESSGANQDLADNTPSQTNIPSGPGQNVS